MAIVFCFCAVIMFACWMEVEVAFTPYLSHPINSKWMMLSRDQILQSEVANSCTAAVHYTELFIHDNDEFFLVQNWISRYSFLDQFDVWIKTEQDEDAEYRWRDGSNISSRAWMNFDGDEAIELEHNEINSSCKQGQSSAGGCCVYLTRNYGVLGSSADGRHYLMSTNDSCNQRLNYICVYGDSYVDPIEDTDPSTITTTTNDTNETMTPNNSNTTSTTVATSKTPSPLLLYNSDSNEQNITIWGNSTPNNNNTTTTSATTNKTSSTLLLLDIYNNSDSNRDNTNEQNITRWENSSSPQNHTSTGYGGNWTSAEQQSESQVTDTTAMTTPQDDHDDQRGEQQTYNDDILFIDGQEKETTTMTIISAIINNTTQEENSRMVTTAGTAITTNVTVTIESTTDYNNLTKEEELRTARPALLLLPNVSNDLPNEDDIDTTTVPTTTANVVHPSAPPTTERNGYLTISTDRTTTPTTITSHGEDWPGRGVQVTTEQSQLLRENQDGNNSISMNTTGAASGSGNATRGVQTGNGNVTQGEQTGSENVTQGEQTGSGNVTQGEQTGSGNVTQGEQTGNGNVTQGEQTGNGNVTQGEQTGNGNVTQGEQTGSGNVAQGEQTGNGNVTQGEQTGNGNEHWNVSNSGNNSNIITDYDNSNKTNTSDSDNERDNHNNNNNNNNYNTTNQSDNDGHNNTTTTTNSTNNDNSIINNPTPTTNKPNRVEMLTPIEVKHLKVKLTTETVPQLREASSSNPPKTYQKCPCDCGRISFDPNPSAAVLQNILTKIQTELKVPTASLSSKRNRKQSSRDQRSSSLTMGALAITLCVLQAFLIVGLDLIRLWQHFASSTATT